MKKRLSFLFVLLCSTIILGCGTTVRASAPDDTVITIPTPNDKTRGVDSGAMDDNGNPISVADYQKLVEKSKENIVQRNPVVTAIVVAVVAVGVTGVIVLKRSKRKV